MRTPWWRKLARLFGFAGNEKRQPIRRKRLDVEVLEDRLAPATIITILDGGVGTLDGFLSATDGTITAADNAGIAGSVSRAALQGVNANVDISITAETSIIVNDLTSTLALQTGAGNSATFTANATTIAFTDTTDGFSSAGGDLNLSAATDATLGALNAAGGNVLVSASDNITLNAALSTTGTGAITVSANTNGGVAQGLTSSAAGTMTTAAGDMNVTSREEMTIGGAISSTAGGNINVSIPLSAATTTMNLNAVISTAGGNGNIHISASDNISITAAVSTAGTGTILIDGDTDLAGGGFVTTGAAGTLTTAGGDVSIVGSDVDLGAAVNVTAGATSDVNLAPRLAATLIDVGADVNFGITDADLAQITAGGAVRIGSAANTGGITVSSAITRHAGFSTLSLITGNTGATAVQQTAALSVAKLDVQSVGTVVLTNAGNDVDFLAASVTGVGSDFLYTDISGFTIDTVDGVVGIRTTAGSDVITLTAGGAVTQTAGADVHGTFFEVFGAGPVTLNNTGNDVVNLSANLTGVAAAFSYVDADPLNIGIVSAAASAGITTNNGNVSVSTVQGFLIVRNDDGDASADVDAGTGTVTLTAGSVGAVDNALTNEANAGVIGTGGVTLTADNISIGATVNAGANVATLRPFEAGTLIDLGGADAANTLGLTNTEINFVTAGILHVGSSTAGAITITDEIIPTGANQLELETGGQIIDAHGGNDLTVTRLALIAQTGIGVSAPNFSIDVTVSNLEARTTTGGIDVNDLNSLIIGNVTAALTGVNVVTSGNIVITANNGTLTLSDINGAETVTGGAASGNVTLTANGATSDVTSTVDQDAITTPRGSITVTAGRDIVLGNGADFDNDVRANNNVTFNAGRDITIEGFADMASDDNGNNTGGSVSFTAGRNINIVSTNGDNASVGASGTGGGNVTLTTSNTTAGSTLTLTVGSSATVFSNSGNVSIDTDRIIIAAASGITANTAGKNVTIQQKSAAWAIDLGSATDAAANTLELSDAELDRIFTPLLRIGSTGNTGSITVTSQLTPANISTLSLRTGGAIIDGTAGEQTDITVTNLALQAATGIGSAEDIDTAVTNLAGNNITTGNIQIANTGSLTLPVGGVDGLVGVTNNAAGGSIFISAASPLVIDSAVSDTGGGNISLVTSGANGSITVTTNGSITASGGNGNILLDTSAATSGGSIIVNDGPNAADISAAGTGNITLRANDAVTIAANVVIQSGNAATGGNITIQSNFNDVNGTDNIVLGANSTVLTRGDITLNADPDGNCVGGAIVMDTTSVLAGPSSTLAFNITLNADEDITLASLNASNTITVTSCTRILDDGVGATIVSAANLALTAPNAIGTLGQSVGFNVNTLTSNSSGNNGGQFLAATGTAHLNAANALNAGSGTITLTAGTFQIQAGAAGNAITDTSTLAVNSPAILDINGNNETINNVISDGTITDTGAAATFTVNNSGADTFAGTFTGTNLSLQKTGGGTLTLTGNSTYGGSTTIGAGTVANGVADALPTGTALSVTGTFDLAGFNQTVGSVTGAGAVTDSAAAAIFTVNNSAADLFVGTLTGSLNLMKTNGGTLTLTGANTYTGTTQISNGTLSAGSIVVVAGSSNLGNAASAVLLGDATHTGILSYTGASAIYTRGFTVNAGGGEIDVTGAATLLSIQTNDIVTIGPLTVGGIGVLIVSSDITGTGSLTKNSAGDLTLNGANTYSGTTELNTGTLHLAGSLDAQPASPVNVNGAGNTLDGGGLINRPVVVAGAATAAAIRSLTINAGTTADGITVQPGAGAVTIANVTVHHSKNGLRLPAGYGNTASVSNSTFSTNSAIGIVADAGTLNLAHVTVALNSAGGARQTAPATVNPKNSLFASNTGFDYSGTFATKDFNLFQSTAGLTLPAGDDTDLTGLPARLAPLGLFGGNQPTHPLLPGSAALDAVKVDAAGLGTDERGVARPSPAGTFKDIGAFESQGFDTSAITSTAGTYLALVTKNVVNADGSTPTDFQAQVDAKTFKDAASVSAVNDTVSFAAVPNLVLGQAVFYRNIGGTVIGGLTNNTTFFAIPTADPLVFKLSTTPGGAAIPLTSAGSGTHRFFLEPVKDGVVSYSSSAAPGEAGSAASSIAFHVLDASLVTTSLNLTSAPLNATDRAIAIYNSSVPANQIGGLVNGTRYFLHTTPNANAVTLSATPTGAPISLTPPGAAATHTLTLFPTAYAANFNGATDRITLDRPMFAAGQQVVFNTNGGALPTNLVDAATYFVSIPTAATPNIIQLSLTLGGPARDISTVAATTQTLRALTSEVFTITATDRVRNSISFGSEAKLVAGQAVVYDKGAAANTEIGNLTSGNTYFVKTVTTNPNTVQLSASLLGPVIVFTSPGAGMQSLLPADRVAAAVPAGTTITVQAPGFKNGDAVVFKAPAGNPTFGLAVGGTYYVVTAGAGLQTSFSLALTPGGTPIVLAAGALGTQCFVAGATGTAAASSILATGVATTNILANAVSSAPGSTYAISASSGGQNATIAWNAYNQAVSRLADNAQPQNTLSGSPIKYGPANAASFQLTLLDQEGRPVVVSAGILGLPATSTIQLSALHSADGQTFAAGTLVGTTISGAIVSGALAFTSPDLKILASRYSRPYYLNGAFTNPDGALLPQKNRITKPFRILPFAFKIFAGNFAGNSQVAFDIITVSSDRGEIRLVTKVSGTGGLGTNKLQVRAYDSPPNLASPPTTIDGATPQATNYDGPVFLTFSVAANSTGPVVAFPANVPVLMPIMMTAGLLDPTSVTVNSAPNGFSVYANFGLTAGLAPNLVGGSVQTFVGAPPIVRAFIFDLAGFAEINTGIDPRQNQGFFTRINLGRQRGR